MRDEEYERKKEERDRKDIKTTLVMLAIMVVALVGGIVFIVQNF